VLLALKSQALKQKKNQPHVEWNLFCANEVFLEARGMIKA